MRTRTTYFQKSYFPIHFHRKCLLGGGGKYLGGREKLLLLLLLEATVTISSTLDRNSNEGFSFFFFSPPPRQFQIISNQQHQQPRERGPLPLFQCTPSLDDGTFFFPSTARYLRNGHTHKPFSPERETIKTEMVPPFLLWRKCISRISKCMLLFYYVCCRKELKTLLLPRKQRQHFARKEPFPQQ